MKPINTARLTLRLLELSDISFLADLESDPEVKKFFPDGARDYAQTVDMIRRFIANYHEKGLPCFLLFDRQTHEFIGRAGFGLTEWGAIEVGYVIHKKFWGQGYASEALAALLQFARERIPAETIMAYALSENIGSTRVMEKCGMTFYKKEMVKGYECSFYLVKNSL